MIIRTNGAGMPEWNDEVRNFRLRLPRHERRHPWLALLLDCYAIIDFSVAEAIRNSAKKVACRNGCSACCHQPIPISVLEALGTRFHVQEFLTPEQHSQIQENSKRGDSLCKFNNPNDNSCIVYSLRPIACRRYIVLSKPCELHENPVITRQNDVLIPSREYLYRSITVTLPFYKSQKIQPKKHEHVFDFYKRHNTTLLSAYTSIISRKVPANG